MYCEKEFVSGIGESHHGGRKPLIWDCGELSSEELKQKDDCCERIKGGRRIERGEHMHLHEHCCCKESHCKGCVCERLRTLAANTFVSQVIFRGGVSFSNLTFRNFDKKTCCVTFRLGTAELIANCRDIVALTA